MKNYKKKEYCWAAEMLKNIHLGRCLYFAPKPSALDGALSTTNQDENIYKTHEPQSTASTIVDI